MMSRPLLIVSLLAINVFVCGAAPEMESASPC